jgi:pyruvate/2-oxoglutarate dehydrogenase complex dihydrolipoamide acyltransferase (E2) component
MRSRIGSAACAAIVLGVSVGILAQDAPAPQSASQSAAAKKITVTGCVGKAQQAATGTTGATGATASAKETKFVLSDASMSSSAKAGTADTAAAPSTTAIASEYKLDADDAKLTPHVGHKVEITGTVEESKGPTQAPAASAANAPTLKVDNLKMVAASCK